MLHISYPKHGIVDFLEPENNNSVFCFTILQKHDENFKFVPNKVSLA